MAGMAINGQIVFLYTEDLRATSAFYEGVLELERVLDQGCCHIFRTGPGAFVGVCEIADRPKSPVGLTLTLITDDVDAWYARLRDKGVAFERDPAYSERFKVYSCLFHDPNGYRVEIQSFADPNISRR